MKPRHWLIVVAVVIVVAVLFIYSNSDDDSNDSTSENGPGGHYPPPPEEPSDDAIFCPVGQAPNTNGVCKPCEDYEGCFTKPGQMLFFYDKIIELVENYANYTYGGGMDKAKEWWYIEPGDTGTDSCTSYDEWSYYYCPLDREVTIGQAQMWQFYQQLGDAAPAVGIAHEWGHHIQTVQGITKQTAGEVQMENQADCIAGAWAGYEANQGVFNIDDGVDTGKLLVAIGEAENPGRSHGTSAERLASFRKGYSEGLFGCNAYYPTIPLIYPN